MCGCTITSKPKNKHFFDIFPTIEKYYNFFLSLFSQILEHYTYFSKAAAPLLKLLNYYDLLRMMHDCVAFQI